jgi:hypothetical protein
VVLIASQDHDLNFLVIAQPLAQQLLKEPLLVALNFADMLYHHFRIVLLAPPKSKGQ